MLSKICYKEIRIPATYIYLKIILKLYVIRISLNKIIINCSFLFRFFYSMIVISDQEQFQ